MSDDTRQKISLINKKKSTHTHTRTQCTWFFFYIVFTVHNLCMSHVFVQANFVFYIRCLCHSRLYPELCLKPKNISMVVKITKNTCTRMFIGEYVTLRWAQSMNVWRVVFIASYDWIGYVYVACVSWCAYACVDNFTTYITFDLLFGSSENGKQMTDKFHLINFVCSLKSWLRPNSKRMWSNCVWFLLERLWKIMKRWKSITWKMV